MDATEVSSLPAGAFSAWLAAMQEALRGDSGSEVACGDCTACCTSSQFVHIGPDETRTLARIPAGLVFRAPRMPEGHVVLGYDEYGHCPMLVDGACSIYEDRPRTCRTYDCRIFAATGVEVADPRKSAIARRVRRWRFEYPSGRDRVEHDGLRAATQFLRSHAELLPEGPDREGTRLATLAVEIHEAFIGRDAATGEPVVVEPECERVRVMVSRVRPT
jgi:uncharacterized protein